MKDQTFVFFYLLLLFFVVFELVTILQVTLVILALLVTWLGHYQQRCHLIMENRLELGYFLCLDVL